MTFTLNDYFKHHIPLVEAEMKRVVNHGAHPSEFNTMLNYHLGFCDITGQPIVLNAGKRIRPMLVLLSAEACGLSPERALPAAAAVELLHNFSLIHDDIEDGDELRRGRPTVWTQWGMPQAINTGDGMFAMAHNALLNLQIAPERVVWAMKVFDDMCVRLTVGQHLDMGFETRADVSAADYMAMIGGKTAALTETCCAIGAIIAGADERRVAQLAAFGRSLGMAFQLQDDVLGIWGDPAKTGKQDSDLAHGKKTLPVLFAAEREARIRERYLRNEKVTLDAAEVDALKGWIEAAGGRAHAEAEAEEAHSAGMAAWRSAEVDNPAGRLLRELALSLLGRAA